MLPPLQCPAMFRALLVTLPLLAGLAQAAPNTLEQRPLSLETAQGTLRGTLLQPRSDEPLAVALLIAGSGPTDRDGNNPADGHNDSLKKLAHNLARHGIASLRYDKRGVAASRAATPNERDLSVDAYVADAVAWGRLLKRDKAFDRLILIGHSEGALIASLAAPQAGADALVTLAGSARPIDQVLREQLSYRLPPPLQAAKPDAELLIVPGMNHVLRIVPLAMPAQLASYNTPRLPLAGVLGAEIADFIQRSTSAADSR